MGEMPVTKIKNFKGSVIILQSLFFILFDYIYDYIYFFGKNQPDFSSKNECLTKG